MTPIGPSRLSVDTSRRTAEVRVPGFTADYNDRKGEEELDALNAAQIMTLDQIERIQELEARAATPGSSKVIASRGMRVVRTISEAEFEKIAAAMRAPP